MKTGISSISIYIPPFYLSHDDLADARDVPRDKFRFGLGNINMAIAPPWDDTVTMAANAGAMAMEASGVGKEEIGLLIVATETAVDQSKPVASFIQGLLGIGPKCRVYEIKHACYAGTAAVMNAVHWIESGYHQGKKALVILSDIAKYGVGSLGEPTQGAGAIAFIISDHTDFIHFLPELNTFYSKDVNDFWRPNDSLTPKVDGKYSIDCYLDALESCSRDMHKNLMQERGIGLLEYVNYFIYHLPFTRMAYKAHCKLLGTLLPELNEEQIDQIYEESFDEKLKPALLGSEQVGNIYTGSVYMGLMSLLEEKGESLEDQNIGIFSYGSGCGSELLITHVGCVSNEQIKYLNFKKQINIRKRITIDEYEDLYGAVGEFSGTKVNEKFDAINTSKEFSRYIFTGVKDDKRQYIKR